MLSLSRKVIEGSTCMANILDYIDWRGDVPLPMDGFNEVDGLILAELSFIDFSLLGISSEKEYGVTLHDASRAYTELCADSAMDLGVLVPKRIPDLLEQAANSVRFGSMRVTDYESVLDERREEQFAAICVEIEDNSVFCAFRGTDDTLVGWKEDLNMGVLDVIPAQKRAVAYLNRIAQKYPNASLLVGGHSKGGNLAVYSSVYTDEIVQSRITKVYNYDGPGFKRSISDAPGYDRISDRILTVMPQSSVVGLILEHEDATVFVRSDAVSIGQHDGFSWQVRGRAFEHVDDLSKEGKRTEETLSAWTESLNDQERQSFVNALYEVMRSTGAHTLSDLSDDGLKSLAGMIRTYRDLDDESQRALSGAVDYLMRANARSFVQELRESQEKGVEALRLKVEETLQPKDSRQGKRH